MFWKIPFYFYLVLHGHPPPPPPLNHKLLNDKKRRGKTTKTDSPNNSRVQGRQVDDKSRGDNSVGGAELRKPPARCFVYCCSERRLAGYRIPTAPCELCDRFTTREFCDRLRCPRTRVGWHPQI